MSGRTPPDYPADLPGVIALGHRHFVRACEQDGHRWWLWWHDCPAVEHVSWGWIGDRGDRASGHVIVSADPLTVQGSLACERCRDHGFIRSGLWQPV